MDLGLLKREHNKAVLSDNAQSLDQSQNESA